AVLGEISALQPVSLSGVSGAVSHELSDRTRPEVEALRAAVVTALATARARRERHRVSPSDDRVLTADEASKRIGLSRFTMLRMRRLPDAGGLPFVRLSQGRIGYRIRDLEAYLVARRVGRLPQMKGPSDVN